MEWSAPQIINKNVPIIFVRLVVYASASLLSVVWACGGGATRFWTVALARRADNWVEQFSLG